MCREAEECTVGDGQDATIRNLLKAMEQRISVLEDDNAIREVLARYGFYADAGLDDDYLALFTDDCVMDVSSGKSPEPYKVIRWDGIAALRDFLTTRTSEHDDGFVGRSMHAHGNNLTVRVENDTAVAHSYSLILHQGESTPVTLLGASINEWRLAKQDGNWKIKERKRRMLGAPDTADILKASEA